MVINHFVVGQGKKDIGKYFLRIVRSGANIFQLNRIAKYVQTVKVAKNENFQSEIFYYFSSALPFATLDTLKHNWI